MLSSLGRANELTFQHRTSSQQYGMFFQESENIAREHRDLTSVIEQIDSQISNICSPAPLRPADFSSALGAEENQVVSVFELLTEYGALVADEMVECQRCNSLMAASAFRKAIDDEDDFECTGCSRRVHPRTEPVVVFRLTEQSVSRTKAKAQLRAVTREEPDDILLGEEPLSQRAKDVLVAMLQLGAIDSDSRKSTQEITVEAFGKCYDANSLKSVMAELKTRRLIDSKRGSGGGCWLTERGRARAEKLR